MSEEIDVALAVEEKATLPADREFVIDRPGHINYAEARGNYSGCKLVSFDTAETSGIEQVNEFFRQRANLLVVGIWPFDTHIDVLYTNTLEGEELEEFQEYSRSISMHMAEWRKERAERKAKRDQVRSDAEIEIKRKVALADHCVANHGRLEKKAKK